MLCIVVAAAADSVIAGDDDDDEEEEEEEEEEADRLSNRSLERVAASNMEIGSGAFALAWMDAYTPY